MVVDACTSAAQLGLVIPGSLSLFETGIPNSPISIVARLPRYLALRNQQRFVQHLICVQACQIVTTLSSFHNLENISHYLYWRRGQRIFYISVHVKLRQRSCRITAVPKLPIFKLV